MIKTFREQYQEDTDIQKQLANGWGYNLQKTSQNFQEKKQGNNPIPVVANITLRKFGNEVIKSQRIQQVQDQIRALQNERILRQLRQVKQESSLDQKSEVITLMENIIQDYNDIIQHKHLINKTSEAKPEIKDAPQKEQSEKEALLAKINAQKALLLRGDLNHQIRLNKQIAQTYRRYKVKLESIPTNYSLRKEQSIARQASISLSKMKKYQSETFSKNQLSPTPDPRKIFSLKINDSNEKLQEQQRNSPSTSLNEGQLLDKFKKIQLKKYLTSKKKQESSNQPQSSNISMPQIARLFQKRCVGPQRKLQNIVDLPFMNRKQLEDFHLMETKVKNEKEALELWKGKVHDFYEAQGLIEKRQADEMLRERTKIQEQSRMLQRQIEIEKNIQKQVKMMDYNTQKKNTSSKQAKQVKVKQKQGIFAELLRKRNSKFSRLWGTKILVKYDPVAQAKSLLKGQAEKIPNTASQSTHTSPQKLNSQILHTSAEEDNLTPDYQGGVGRNISVWNQQRGDQEHYWRMCKNQKINLLLKRR